MRRSVGTAMLWCAFGVTLFGLFLTPVFYSVVRWFVDRRPAEPALRRGPAAAPSATIPDYLAGVRPSTFHASNGHAENARVDVTMYRELGVNGHEYHD